MKKMMLKSVIFALAGTSLFSSCIGSFSLFNKLAKWNLKATDNKFLNAIIGIVISPAYGICMFADWIVLNTVAVWTIVVNNRSSDVSTPIRTFPISR